MRTYGFHVFFNKYMLEEFFETTNKAVKFIEKYFNVDLPKICLDDLSKDKADSYGVVEKKISDKKHISFTIDYHHGDHINFGSIRIGFFNLSDAVPFLLKFCKELPVQVLYGLNEKEISKGATKKVSKITVLFKKDEHLRLNLNEFDAVKQEAIGDKTFVAFEDEYERGTGELLVLNQKENPEGLRRGYFELPITWRKTNEKETINLVFTPVKFKDLPIKYSWRTSLSHGEDVRKYVEFTTEIDFQEGLNKFKKIMKKRCIDVEIPKGIEPVYPERR